MLFTGGLLGLLYVVFAVVLFSVLIVGLAPLLIIVVGLAFFQYYTSDKVALAASGAKVVSAEEEPELHAMVERLCAMANLPKPRIAIVDTDVPNAFATGRNPKHAAVAVTTGLWRRLEPQEVESVLAHELSHVANRDVLVMTVASFFAMLAALLTRFGLYSGMFGGFGSQLLAAAFRFDGDAFGSDHPVYWIYGFKTGTWWPFIPTGSEQERDNARELELKAKLEPELPIEPDLSKWLALYGAPI